MIVRLLPRWCLANPLPAFYDVASGTAIEQTARLYAKMNELIETYNKFVDECNKIIVEFSESEHKDNEEFRTALRQEFQDFIDIVDLKIKGQDAKIDDAVEYLKDNLSENINLVVHQMIDNGELNLSLEYKEETEELNLVISDESNLPSGSGGASSWNELKDKPFGEELKHLINEETVTFTDGFAGLNFALIQGNTYNVTINGEKFNDLIVSEEYVVMGMVHVGDMTIAMGSSNGESYPFVLATNIADGSTTFGLYDKSLTEVTISVEELAVTKIPEKYIPKGNPSSVIYYNVSGDILYKDFFATEKVTKAELQEAMLNGAIWIWFNAGYSPAIRIKDSGADYATVVTYYDQGTATQLSMKELYTAEYTG